MTKNSYITIVCVLSSLFGLYRALLNCPLESIMIPWFVIPVSAVLVFWFHGDTPVIRASKVVDSVTDVTLSDVQYLCNQTNCGNMGLDISLKRLSQQANSFKKLLQAMDDVFSMKYGSETSDSLIHCVEDLRDSFVKNAVNIISKANTMNSISMYQEADLAIVNKLINENNGILIQVKQLVDIVIDFDIDD